jgi:uncharacterized membrane protein YccC
MEQVTNFCAIFQVWQISSWQMLTVLVVCQITDKTDKSFVRIELIKRT